MRVLFLRLSDSYIALLGLVIMMMLGWRFSVVGAAVESDEIFKREGLLIGMLMGGWLVSSGVGVILRKEWGRISLIAMAGLALLNGVVMSLMLLFYLFPEIVPAIKPVIGAFFLVFLVAVPTFFLVFLNKSETMVLFNSNREV